MTRHRWLAYLQARLLPLQPEAAKQLLIKRLRAAPGRVQPTLDRLNRDGLQDFLTNPLLLTLVAVLVVRKRGHHPDRLPAHRVGLFRQAVDVLLGMEERKSWPLQNRARAFQSPAQARKVLSEVALAVHGEPGAKLRLSEVQQRLARALDDRGLPTALLEIQRITGLVELRPVGGGQDLVLFRHRALREHLAASRIAELVGLGQAQAPTFAAVLARAARAPAQWGGAFAQACALLGGHAEDGTAPRPDLVDRLVDACREEPARTWLPEWLRTPVPRRVVPRAGDEPGARAGAAP